MNGAAMKQIVNVVKRHLVRLRRSRAAPVAFVSVVVLVLAAVWLRCGPLPAELLDENAAPSTEVFDRHGERLYEARSALGTRSERLEAATLPPVLAHATLAAEDTRFHRHIGVDPGAVV